ncbi:hypothetical protein [Vibrio europaeus]|uniref:hypothetical protein n=1 Tax=Vibrio europaeus TaxID=300876 RepID=UPI00233F689E|nr:hypothetical protein [Vibrio europaeus]MDC5753520.1 hypothetical protein [Vibrio europaeus]MDC5816567.1 hypothetical protein [Vibrio europaeus]
MQFDKIREFSDSLLSPSTFWGRFKGSEFYEYLVNWFTQLFYRNQQVMEVRLMEGHISQANRSSSIRAHAQDRGYVPLKRQANKHLVTATNNTSRRIDISEMQNFVSQDNNLNYLSLDAVIIEPNSTVDIEVIQGEKHKKSFTVNALVKYLQVLIDRDTSRRMAQFDVYVTHPVTGNKDKWTKSYLFRNATKEDKVYVEFSTATEETGIRFGDGQVSGLVPEIDSIIDVEYITTEGFSSLPSGQELTCLDESINEAITFTSKSTLIVGTEREDIESIRTNAQYHTTYDNNTVWDGDYNFFFSNNVRGLTFLNIWGEAKQEKLFGSKEPEHINKIYICPFHPGQTKAETKAAVELLCQTLDEKAYEKEHVYVEPKENKYTIQLAGKILSSKKVVEVEKSVKVALAKFTETDGSHKGKTTQDDLWRAIDALKILTSFKIEISEALDVDVPIDTFRFLDLEGSQISITR